MTRPGVPIVAFTLSPIVARRLAVRRGGHAGRAVGQREDAEH